MPESLLTCLSCGYALPAPSEPATGPRECMNCDAYYEIGIFPAFSRLPEPGSPAENVIADGESSCLYHPAKKASVICNGCGAFLCSLCDIELDGRHVCPKCLTRPDAKTAQADPLQPESTRYDSIAFHLALWPLLLAFMCLPYVMLITAPVVLYLAIRYWNVSRMPDGSPSGLMLAAALIAGAELVLVAASAVIFALGIIALVSL